VSFDVTNTGSRAGAAVAQLYVSGPAGSVPRPSKELKGFSRVMLQQGETKRVTIPLSLRSLAYYDVSGRDWRADRGTYKIVIGNSSADTPASATLTLVRFATTQ
jgi:beta-glucosidase